MIIQRTGKIYNTAPPLSSIGGAQDYVKYTPDFLGCLTALDGLTFQAGREDFRVVVNATDCGNVSLE